MERLAEQPQSRYEKFSEESRQVLIVAQGEAERLGHNYIGTQHILLGLLKNEKVLKLLQALDVSPEKIKEETEFAIEHGQGEVGDGLGLNRRAKKVVELAVDEARLLPQGSGETTPIHLLIGILRQGQGLAESVLISQTQEDYDALISKIRKFNPSGPPA